MSSLTFYSYKINNLICFREAVDLHLGILNLLQFFIEHKMVQRTVDKSVGSNFGSVLVKAPRPPKV